jgi:hypothetical protein
MNNRKLASFQGQIETVLQLSLADLDLRVRRLFKVLRIKSHLTSAEIRKWDGYAPIQLMFVLVNLVFLHVGSVHDLTKRFAATFKTVSGVGAPSTGALSDILAQGSIGQRL